MKIRETKMQQFERLKEICVDKNIDHASLNLLLESVRTKKMHSRRNYHQQTIDDTIIKLLR